MLGAENRGNVTCYLDSLLFAMFARLGSFEPILHRTFEDEPRRRLSSLIRLWVNMLRTGKLIQTDIVRKDPSHDLGELLTSKIRHNTYKKPLLLVAGRTLPSYVNKTLQKLLDLSRKSFSYPYSLWRWIYFMKAKGMLLMTINLSMRGSLKLLSLILRKAKQFDWKIASKITSMLVSR